MKFLKYTHSIKTAIRSEMHRLMLNYDIGLEHSLMKHKRKRILMNYIVMAVIWLMIISISLILYNTKFLYQKHRTLAGGIILILPFSVLCLSKWTYNVWINILACCLLFGVVIFWMEILIIESINHTLLKEKPYSLIFYSMVAYMLLYRMTIALMQYQPLYLQSTLLYVQWLYLIIRFTATDIVNIESAARAAMILPLYNFLLYINWQGALECYGKLFVRQKNISEIISLMDAISMSPLYVIKLPSMESMNKVCGEANTTTRLSTDIKYRAETFRNMLADVKVNVFSRESIEDKNRTVTTEEVFMVLDKIEFKEESRFVVLANQRSMNLEDMISNQKIPKPIRFVLQEIMLCNFKNQRISEIVIVLYLILLDFGMQHFVYQFGLRNVNNNEYFANDGFKIFDIDILFLTYEESPAIIVAIHDISSRYAVSNLQLHNETLDRSLSSITHDMRAPLHAILGYTENLAYKVSQLTDCDQAKLSSCIKKITANCEHLSALVNDILDSARIEHGSFSLNVTEFDLPQLITECIDLAQTIEDSTNIEFFYRGPMKLSLSSDYYRLKRILLNLLTNSIKFTERGTVKIECKALDTVVRLIVTDTGPGIDLKLKKKIMLPFVSYSKLSLKSKKSGVGLGLSTTRMLIGHLGPSAKIEIKSIVNKGSSFMFEIYRDLSKIKSSKPADKGRSFNGNKRRQSADKIKGFNHLIEMIGTYDNYAENMDYRLSNSLRRVDKGSFRAGSMSPEKRLSPVSNIGRLEIEIPTKHFENEEVKGSIEESISEEGLRKLPTTVQKKGISSTSPTHYYQVSRAASNIDLEEIRIFILEDDIFNRDILIMYLTRFFKETKDKLPLRIDMHMNVKEAITIVKENAEKGISYNIIFTDYYLSGDLTGVYFAKEVKAVYNSLQMLHPSFILVSGRSPSAQEAGIFFRCILKPFSFDQFSQTLDRWLQSTYAGVTRQTAMAES